MINSRREPIAIDDRPEGFHTATLNRDNCSSRVVDHFTICSDPNRYFGAIADRLPRFGSDLDGGLSISLPNVADNPNIRPTLQNGLGIYLPIATCGRDLFVGMSSNDRSDHEQGHQETKTNQDESPHLLPRKDVGGICDTQLSSAQDDAVHFTPFGARVTPPVIVLPRPQRPYRAIAAACPMLWAAAVLLMLHLVYATGSAAVELDRQIAMADRV